MAAVLVALGGCGEHGPSPGGQPHSTPSPSITISLAASTQEAVKAIADRFRQEHGVPVQINAGASNALAAQILAGAPADLFLSASPDWTDALKAEGLTTQTCNLVGNRLVIVTPRGNPAGVYSPQDLLAEQVDRIALAGEKVPAGVYAEQALTSLGMRDALAGKLVRGADVRVALSYVERGEAEAGIVYATDARLSTAVETVYEFPATSHNPITYPLALLQHGQSNPAAKQFYEYLQSTEAGETFVKYGFATPPNNVNHSLRK